MKNDKLGGLSFGQDDSGNWGFTTPDGDFQTFGGGNPGLKSPEILIAAKTGNVISSLTLDKDYAAIAVLMCQTNGNVTYMFYNDVTHYADSDYLLATSKRAGIHVFTNCKKGDVLKPTNNSTYSIWSVIAWEYKSPKTSVSEPTNVSMLMENGSAASYTFTQDYISVSVTVWNSSGATVPTLTYNGSGLRSNDYSFSGSGRAYAAKTLANVKAGDTISRNAGTHMCIVGVY